MKQIGFLLVIGASVSLAAPVRAQTFDLTVRNIMRGPELYGTAPHALRGGEPFSWSPDGKWIYFRWKQPGVDTAEVAYRVTPSGGTPERLATANADTIVAGDAAWSPDRTRAVFALDGDLVLWSKHGTRRLTWTPDRESHPQWSADGGKVFFERGGNAYALDLSTAALRQLTDIRSGTAPGDTAAASPQRARLAAEQHRLFDFIKSGRYTKQPWGREHAQPDTTRPTPFYPGAHAHVSDMEVSPDGEDVLLTVRYAAKDARSTDIAIWITADGYEHTYKGRTKVGDAQGTSRAAVLDVRTGAVTFVGDSVAGRPSDVQGMAVSSDARHALLRIESRDHKDRWWTVVDLPDLATRTVAHDHDDAWIGFPGPAIVERGGFLRDGETVYFGSERTGWAQLYEVPATGGDVVPVTSGRWEVLDATLAPDGKMWYLTANKDGFADVHFYTVPARGGAITRVTSAKGRQDVAVSPDGRWLAVSHSVANHPPELYVQRDVPGAAMRKVTESTTAAWRSYPWVVPEIVMIPASDGVQVPARLFRPTDSLEAAGHRPAVIFVHGAGYLQEVDDWWSDYSREYMFDNLLAAHGYTVLDVDYRGSAGHGRDWRTAIYRHMGGRDLDDQVDAAHWLVHTMGIDSTRIGIYGGSYGGFTTLMAMFTKPGIFAAGAALRPVSDWSEYNDPYTSAILNDPQDDSVAYVRSSPIYHAAGLQGRLLICHGLVDDNVLFYDTARLIQRLIELGKDGWSVQFYPVERHGFTETSSWQDEYSRVFRLFQTTIRRDRRVK